MDNYDPNEESKYIIYLDANNLYGYGMRCFLPSHGFEWVDVVENFDFNISDESDIGYILEVDLSYPQDIHDLQKDIPMYPERAAPPGSKHPKLLATLNDKERYVIHYRCLKQAVKHGIIVKKIHRILKFNQSPCLRDYIDLITDFRKKSTNDFQIKLYKNFNNSVFGKTLENVRNHRKVFIKTEWEGRYGVESLISKPNFYRRVIFDDDLVAIEMKNMYVTINKPVYVGMCILDISKTLMYSFHYDYILPKYKDSVTLNYTDTDSFIYEFKCDDFYEDMKRDIHMYDTSDYPVDNIYNMPLKNKKIIGFFKDEANGLIISRFIGLRSKMYAFELENLKQTKKAKGVKSYVVSKQIGIDDYENCLFNNEILICNQNCIRSKLHNVYTVTEKKVGLSPFDDKRFLIHNSTNTLPWGHKNIMEFE